MRLGYQKIEMSGPVTDRTLWQMTQNLSVQTTLNCRGIFIVDSLK